MTAGESQEFEQLLDYLKESRGFDFRAYKKTTLQRRIERRMDIIGVKGFANYQGYLASEPEEFGQLFNTFLINVTGFFRDGAPWEFVAQEIIPALIKNKGRLQPIRLWSAGCATGEEAYTLAMLFAEALGYDEFKNRVKIYATDIDEHALTLARQADYDEKSIIGIPAEMLAKYFEPKNGRFCFSKDLRRSVIFGRHDLLQDAPISKIDVLTCRNTLMYFNAPAQARILARLHFALNEGGFLFLGRAETLLAHSSTFRAIDIKQRIFAKIPSVRLSPQLYLVRSNVEASAEAGGSIMHDDIRDAALNISGVAQLVVDRGGDLILANEAARSFFTITNRDVGRPFHELEVSYKPVELRSLIERAYAEESAINVSSIEHKGGPKESMWLDLQLIPLVRRNGEVAGVTITFTDVTQARRLQQTLERTHTELELAYEQLQSANEEMETTNEELQSAVEELETTNEELQASNEELETMNEELQSMNDELQSVNDTSRTYTHELDHVNRLLESIFYGLGESVIAVDQELKVIFCNKGVEELWGISVDEARRSAINELDIGLPIEKLLPDIEKILSGERKKANLDIGAMNRRGKPIQCRITIAPLFAEGRNAVIGAIILASDLTA